MKPFIIHPKNDEESNVVKAFLKALKIKFEHTKVEDTKSTYAPEFVITMERSIEDVKAGRITQIELDEIYKGSPYDPEFVKIVQEGRADHKAGKVTDIDKDKLWE